MTLTLKTGLNRFFFLLLCLGVPLSLQAQASSLSLSVSPTIFEMSANPGQTWQSNIRVINSNAYEIRVYADRVNFAPRGERGASQLIPIEPDSDNSTLAEWITVPEEQIVIPPEQTTSVPITISVPENAPPGGHFAAVLIGTRPPENQSNETLVDTAQVVTSLIFLRVSGDVIETGSIRSFRTSERLLERPNATFELRFENTGNVHIRPQGEIAITNMWGEERGVIPVNQQTLFGNVLPDSVRNFSFTWEGEWSLGDIGRYKANATLAYGENSRQFTSAETYFWVIPWREVGIVLLVFFSLILLIVWGIKAYIRRVILLSGLPQGATVANDTAISSTTSHPESKAKLSMVAPLEAGILDLRKRFEGSVGVMGRLRVLVSFLSVYRMFFIIIIALVLLMIGIVWFVQSATETERSYQVTIEGLDRAVTIDSEAVRYEELKSQSSDENNNELATTTPIRIINRSGQPGLAANVALFLESVGYTISTIETDFGPSEDVSVIVYSPQFTTEALALSQSLDGVLLSAYNDTEAEVDPITLFLGQDLNNKIEFTQ